ncbi:MAG: hypothetical protein KBG15_21890, partial [Kofleriaceae bacterium]|nr:hypothetical protein [Kofleriaceae bacterium]
TIRVMGPDLGTGSIFGKVTQDELQREGSDDWIARIDGETLRWSGPTEPNKIVGLSKPEYRRTVLIWLAASYIEMNLTSQE